MARLPRFVSALPNDRFLVNAPTGMAVETDLFRVPGSGVVAVIDPQDLDDPENLGEKAVREALGLYLASGNDGGLAWIPAPFAAAFAPFVAIWLTQALERGALNLDNGALSEAFVLYPVADGLVVGMIDPECGTAVFDDLLDAFATAHHVPREGGAFDPDRLFSFEDCHLASNLRLGRSSAEVDGFLLALFQRGLLGDAFALGEDVPEAVADWLDGLKVTVTGTFSVPREEIEGWLEEHGAVITGTPSAQGVLLIGDKPGKAKLEKAAKVGTPRLTMADLVAKLVTTGRPS